MVVFFDLETKVSTPPCSRIINISQLNISKGAHILSLLAVSIRPARPGRYSIWESGSIATVVQISQTYSKASYVSIVSRPDLIPWLLTPRRCTQSDYSVRLVQPPDLIDVPILDTFTEQGGGSA